MSRTPIHFLRSLETIPGRAAVLAQWRRALAEDWDWAQPLLRASDELADSYPRFAEPPNADGAYELVWADEPNDRYVLACPDGNGTVEARREHLVVYDLDMRGLAERLAAAFGLEFDYRPIDALPHAVRIGRAQPGPGEEVCVYLTTAGERSDVACALADLAARHDQGAVLLTPTRAAWGGWPDHVDRVRVVALCDSLRAAEAPGVLLAADDVVICPSRRATSDGTPPHAGRGKSFMRIEDVGDAHPELSPAQVEAVRKRLERWRATHEDDAFVGDSDPASGRRRYGYPTSIVDEAVAEVLAKPIRRARSK